MQEIDEAMGEYLNSNNENIRNWLRDAITLTDPSPQNESMTGENHVKLCLDINCDV